MGRMNHLEIQPAAPAKPALARRPSRSPSERRSGKDRRGDDQGPPDTRERRTTLESRQPDVAEIEMSESEWAAFNGPAKPSAPAR